MTIPTTSPQRRMTPLNMRITLYRTNYDADLTALPPDLMMGLTLVTVPGITVAELNNAMLDLAKTWAWLERQFHSGLIQNPVLIGPVTLHFTMVPAWTEISEELIRQFHPVQRNWFYHGYYLQLVFWDHESMNLAAAPFPAATSMTLLDRWALHHGTTEAREHKAMLVDRNLALDYSFSCGFDFDHEKAIWNRNLVDIRNRILVSHRALIRGRDPIVEWQRFVASGGWHFTQYSTLIP